MDMTVYEGSRIARLPGFLHRPALVVRNVLSARRVRHAAQNFRFEADGLGTNHYCPFEDDHEFSALYARMRQDWFANGEIGDVRWRMWLLTRCARQCSHKPGAFTEFGVYRAGCAFMILATDSIAPAQQFFLFDTFAGIPHTNLTENEREHGFGGRLADTSAEYVAQKLQAWRDHIRLVKGDVFETLKETETGPIAFSHIDLNASAPTAAALEYVYPRLVSGGMIVFDDYGFAGYEDQRREIDRFFAEKPENVIATPIGPALVVKV